MDLVLAASVTDWVERIAPPLLFVFGLCVLALRRRDRLRGPDEDDES